MNQGGPRISTFFLLFISILTFQVNFAWADEWEDAGFSIVEDKNSLYSGSETELWKTVGFTNASEAKRWKLGGYSADEAAELAGYFSTADEAKKFTAKHCKNGFEKRFGIGKPSALASYLAPPPANHNDDDGSHCYMLLGKVFQLLSDNQALYQNEYERGQNLYFVSFGKGGRAVSSIKAFVTVKGGYKYQSLAGIKIVPELRVLKTINQ